MILVQILTVSLLLNIACSMENENDVEDVAGEPHGPRRHRHYSLGEKIRLLDDYHQENIRRPHGVNAANFAREHNIPPTTFRRWLNGEDDLRERSAEATRRQLLMQRQRQRGIGE